jgi:hypothetical protein
MDHLNVLGVPLIAAADGPSGWDAHAVWRERVQKARRAGTSDRPTITVSMDHSAGWDPLETWRLRVQRPRARK